MTYEVRWLDEAGDQSTAVYGHEDEAREAVKSLPGVALVTRLGGDMPSIFREGVELRGEDATAAFTTFGYRIEVGVSVPEDRGNPVEDATGTGWQEGLPAQWGWRVWRGTDGASSWNGPYGSREQAKAAAETAQQDDPELDGLRIVFIADE